MATTDLKELERIRSVSGFTLIGDGGKVYQIYSQEYRDDEKFAGQLKVKFFKGRAVKPTKFYRFQTKEKAGEFARKWVDQIVVRKIELQARKEKEKVDPANLDVKVGDIFASSWGYSMTLVDFYQVVAIKGISVSLRAVKQDRTGGGYTGQATPIPNSFGDDNILVKRLKGSGRNLAVRIHSSSRAYLMEKNVDGTYPSLYYNSIH